MLLFAVHHFVIVLIRPCDKITPVFLPPLPYETSVNLSEFAYDVPTLRIFETFPPHPLTDVF